MSSHEQLREYQPKQFFNKTINYKLVYDVEQIMVNLLESFTTNVNTQFVFNKRKRQNLDVLNKVFKSGKIICNSNALKINYNNYRSRHRFSMILYVLAIIHHQLLSGGGCKLRELYYNDMLLMRTRANVNKAILDVSNILCINCRNLGLLASGKGLVAGNLRIYLMNGDIIDCDCCEGGTLIAQNSANIERIEANADYVLLVEKDTIFSKLISRIRHSSINIILITGRGYPDVITRMLVYRLHKECRLPMYLLVDADPFGVEIMLVYRYGSKALGHILNPLVNPDIRWIGIHPSEFRMVDIQTYPLTRSDNIKLKELLQRDYVALSIKRELQLLFHMQRKAEIEGISDLCLNFLIYDYIPNKIKRNLFI